jgi:Cof subfamily protein (haloacid dehalogenase superfamily)
MPASAPNGHYGSEPEPVRLVVADVDGTLLTPDKTITPRAQRAVLKLREAGIAFAITSSRPPKGLAMFIEPLGIREPIAAFNGGLLVRPDLSIIDKHPIPPDVAQGVIDRLGRGGLDVWVYTDQDWRVPARHGPHVDREERAVKFAPIVVSSFDDVRNRAIKIVGVSDDGGAIARCFDEVRGLFGQQVAAALSQTYYLDVTHAAANKGQVVATLSAWLGVPLTQIATIGDMANDVLMFTRTGTSIAMGNASPDVKGAARFVTKSNTEDGFARAMERFVLRLDAIVDG